MGNQFLTQCSLFYCSIDDVQSTSLASIVESLQMYSDKESKQVYILDRILGNEKKTNYSASNVAVILIPKHQIIFLNYGNNSKKGLDDFKYEYIDDLMFLARNFDYSLILGRPRDWKNDIWFDVKDVSDFDIDNYVKTEIKKSEERAIDLLISLAIGSINSIDRIGTEEPKSKLEKVKRKIVLFDGQQTKFIYSHDSATKRITIQGLAGTGKTELLMNKLKDIYLSSDSIRVAFTCFNKVLATEMKENRIPQFFNFMQVRKQIEWGTRLHAFSSWGSKGFPESGLYSYVTNYYGITFYRFSECRDFAVACRKAVEELNAIEEFEPCFDYVFIDESQDFSEEFFQLCEKVTKGKVIVAGDIFQNIFDSDNSTEQVDFLLNKCYRTEPKTLMFAHAIGMGLYEEQKVNWLTDEGWRNCGYNVKRYDGKIQLSRSPLRRFEDLDATDTIRFTLMEEDNEVDNTITAIESIMRDYEGVSPDDIAIVVLNRNHNTMVSLVNNISYELFDKFGWNSNKGFETKKKVQGTVYISNINNIKGLEFPFLICVCTNKITNSITIRNQIYTVLTRSFLVSYFLIQNENEDFFKTYIQALKDINDNEYIEINEPNEAERKRIETRLEEAKKQKKSEYEDIIISFLASNPSISRAKIESNALEIYNSFETDDEILKKLTDLSKLMGWI
ncbi:DEAD/DEAH box helicase [Ruminococcus flavefaciens]|uniref:DEAD/DEAH box helicase n=1 Tax=Ruminococcus flavefaciens TaxID=1265 RepID=UPI0026EB50F3|nr:AAA family ATPase [Ruminococcus flavefaciens]